jgi:hypothetical protein
VIAFNGKQHIKIFLITWGLMYLDRPQNLMYFALGGLIGCLLPDIDHKESIAGHIIPAWLVFRHGRETHTVIACFIILALFLYYRNDFLYGLLFGYLGHLIGDDMQGKPLKYLYYPFMAKKKEC